jgi:hypothetical protein
MLSPITFFQRRIHGGIFILVLGILMVKAGRRALFINRILSEILDYRDLGVGLPSAFLIFKNLVLF